tara:strand:+ start:445 stop:987 length:543 start_codon:yes stop_codon:yes gene_type:complete
MSYSYRNIIFDRDGIINDVVIRHVTVSSPRNLKEFILKEDFKKFIKKLPSSLNLFVATNQPDIARGLLKKTILKKMHEDILEIYPIREIFVCMHDNKDMCACRKPKPGMIEEIIKKYNLSKSETCIVGDSSKDVEAGLNAGINSFLLATEYNKDIQLKYKKNTNICLFRDFNELECFLGS